MRWRTVREGLLWSLALLLGFWSHALLFGGR